MPEITHTASPIIADINDRYGPIAPSGEAVETSRKQSRNIHIIKDAEKTRFSGEMVGKIISSYAYIDHDVLVDDFADALIDLEEINAVGVVDDEGKVIGLISRKDLFDTLSKPFGRDLYRNKTVDKVLETAPVFPFSRNILTVSQEISHTFQSSRNRFYILVTEDNRFAGIFTNKDMLIYLSELTQKDILMAKKIQSGIVKERDAFDTVHIEALGSSSMAKGIGGDYYTLKKYNDTNWFFSICDVSGKGVSASLVSVLISGMATIYDFNRGIPDFIKTLNGYIKQTFDNEKFVTGLFMDFNEKTGDVFLYDLGHTYAFVYREKKMIKLMARNDCLPMGVVDDVKARGSSYKLRPGDIMVLMTDGFEEQKNMQGEEYGLKRLFRLVHKHSSRDLMHIRNAVYSDVRMFRGGHPQQDDMTLIMVRYKGSSS